MALLPNRIRQPLTDRLGTAWRAPLWRAGAGLAGAFLLFGLTRMILTAAEVIPMQNKTNPAADAAVAAGGVIYTNAAAAIKVAAGAAFTIRLPSNPTTGYQWRLADLPGDAPARLLEHRFDPPAVTRIGAGGHEQWIFEAMQAGAMEVPLTYLRSWEPDKPHTQCVFKVEILPGAKTARDAKAEQKQRINRQDRQGRQGGEAE